MKAFFKSFSLCFALILVGCGGGSSQSSSTPSSNSSSSSSSSVSLAEVKVQGVVSYGSPLANANVIFTAGNTSVTTKTDATGKYELTFKAPAADATQLIKAVARGTGVQAEIELASLLPSLNVLIQQSGNDKLLDSSENFDVNITNLTSATFGLLAKTLEMNPAFVAADLEKAKFTVVASSYRQGFAALVKLIADNPEYELPDGMTTTLELMLSFDDADELLDFIEDQDAELLQQTIAGFAANPNLVKLANNNLATLAGITDAGLAKCVNATAVAALADVVFIDCEGAGVVSLAGLEKLVNLRGINIADNNLNNKVLDVSKNPKLEALDASGNGFTSANLQSNLALTHLVLVDNEFQTLDLSQNLKLVSLNLDSNQLTSLNVQANTGLQTLTLSYNQLKSLDVSTLVELRDLWLYDNPLLWLDVSKNPQLTVLGLLGQSFDSLDLSKNTKLEYFYSFGVPLKAIDTSKMPELKGLYLGQAQIFLLNLANNKKLEHLMLIDSNVFQLDLSQQTKLQMLWARNNNFDTLDLSKNTKLTEVNLEYSGLVSITGLDNIEDKSAMIDLYDNPLSQQTITYLLGLEAKGFTNLSFDPSP